MHVYRHEATESSSVYNMKHMSMSASVMCRCEFYRTVVMSHRIEMRRKREKTEKLNQTGISDLIANESKPCLSFCKISIQSQACMYSVHVYMYTHTVLIDNDYVMFKYTV